MKANVVINMIYEIEMCDHTLRHALEHYKRKYGTDKTEKDMLKDIANHENLGCTSFLFQDILGLSYQKNKQFTIKMVGFNAEAKGATC